MGAVKFCVTLTKATFVQPLLSVTVTELLPGVVSCAWLVVSLFDHKYVYGAVPPEATAVAVTDKLLHVNTPETVADAFNTGG